MTVQFPSGQFYSNFDPKRSRRLKLAEEAAAAIGPDLRQTVTGPSIVRREFSRQDEAIQFARLDTDLSVFSWEVGRQGERKFLVCHSQMFWKFYKNLTVKNYYEVIPKNEPCKLYFDLEFMKEFNPSKDGHLMTQKLIEVINLGLAVEFSLKNIPEDVLVLESSSEKKFSVHLIFCKTVFSSNDQCGRFVKSVLSTVDKSVQELFSVKDKSGLLNLFIDRSVYSSNRNFRLFLSSKLGKNIYLQTSPLDLHSVTIVETNTTIDQDCLQSRIFYASLICNVARSSTRLVVSDKHGLSDDKAPLLASPTHTQHRGQAATASPFAEIDQFVASLVLPGCVRRWQYNQSNNTIMYDITGTRWCAKVGRQHKSNNVYWVCHLDRGVVVQGCHDNACKGFKGEEVMLPDSAMPWRFMGEEDEEAWDDQPGQPEIFDNDDDQILLDASRNYDDQIVLDASRN